MYRSRRNRRRDIIASTSLAMRSGLRRLAHHPGARLLAVWLGLMGACGSATPTAPSAVNGDRVPTSDIRSRRDEGAVRQAVTEEATPSRRAPRQEP